MHNRGADCRRERQRAQPGYVRKLRLKPCRRESISFPSPRGSRSRLQAAALKLRGAAGYAQECGDCKGAATRSTHAVAPDQRGYARSGKPENLEAYRIKHLVRDILGLAESLSPGRPFSIVGHDWGASVAYATAIAAPGRVARLVVLNGVHPGPFQHALLQDAAQRAASAYIHHLRDVSAEARLSANRFDKLRALLRRFGGKAWLTPAKEAGYLEAWSVPGALTAMLRLLIDGRS